MDKVFVNGLIKSKEKYLITERAFLLSCEAEDFSSALRVLRENGFGKDGEVSPSDYETFVSDEWNEFFGFLKKYSPYDWFLKAFSAKFDFFNAEYAMREFYAGASQNGYMQEGLVSVSSLRAYLKGEKAYLPEEIKEVIESAKPLFDGERSGREISVLFKRAYYAFALKTVKNGEYKKFLIHEIDALNLSVALRSISEKQAKEQFISGGKIKEKTLTDIILGRGDKAVADLKHTEYGELIIKGLADKAEGKALTDFEKTADDFAMDKLKEKKYETEGIIPLLLYCYYKTSEVRNARIVLAGKASGIEKEEIKRRLRSGYAG